MFLTANSKRDPLKAITQHPLTSAFRSSHSSDANKLYGFLRNILFLFAALALVSNLAHAQQQLSPTENTGGALGDGFTNDTIALQSVLKSNRTIVLGHNKTYRITSRLNITHNGTGIVGDGTATLLMGTEPGEFDNSSPDEGVRYGINAIGLFADGVNGPVIKGVKIRYEKVIDDRSVKAIVFRNCKNFRIVGNNISNFSKARGIVYIGNSRNGIIGGNEIHSSATNSVTFGQITGIELDSDDPGSVGIDIIGNYIHDLTVGEDFLKKFNYQTDGINTTIASYDVAILNNVIENVGEGIDTFSRNGLISGNRISNAYAYGIKLTHGASNNVVTNNTIMDSGFGGITLEGTNAVARNITDNYIAHNQIIGVNTLHDHDTNSTFGITIRQGRGTTYLSRRNVIESNFVALGGTALFGITAEVNSGTLNHVLRNTVSGWLRVAYDLDHVVVPNFVP